jgi:hypothetical protein
LGSRIGRTKRGGEEKESRHLELDVDDAAEQLGGQIVEAHLVAGDLVHGGLHLEIRQNKKHIESVRIWRANRRGRAESRGGGEDMSEEEEAGSVRVPARCVPAGSRG